MKAISTGWYLLFVFIATAIVLVSALTDAATAYDPWTADAGVIVSSM